MNGEYWKEVECSMNLAHVLYGWNMGLSLYLWFIQSKLDEMQTKNTS